MLKCNQVSRIVSTDDYHELGFMKKVEFKLHLMMCSHCQRYVEQIKSLGRVCREQAKDLEADEEQLVRMEDKIREDVGGTGN